MSPQARKNNRSTRSRKNSNGLRWRARLLDGAILVCTVVIGVFVFSVAGRLSYTRAEKANFAPRVLRTQILNGCGEPGLAAEFGERLTRASIEEFRFDVIDHDNFNRFDVDESFITVYTLSTDDALRLAAAMGFSPDHVFLADNTDNPWGLDASIVLGRNTRPVLPALEGIPSQTIP